MMEILAHCRLQALLAKHEFVSLGGVRPDLLRSAAVRGDWGKVEMFLRDWQEQDRRAQPVYDVTKFVPGEHYYAIDEKFDSLDAARAHIAQRGGRVGELKYKYVYTRRGD